MLVPGNTIYKPLMFALCICVATRQLTLQTQYMLPLAHDALIINLRIESCYLTCKITFLNYNFIKC